MILNISPDHMDRYIAQKDYLKAKLNIAKNLVPPAWLVYNADDSVLKTSLRDKHRTQLFSLSTNQRVKYQVENNKLFFNKNNKKTILFRLDELSLMGNHNLENIIAAATAANLFGIKNDIIKKQIIDFEQLEHRMEIVKSPFPIKFINDSKATNIASTIAAIKSFKNITLILGGQDKGNTDFAEISKFLKNRVNQIISYGKSGQKFANSSKNLYRLYLSEIFLMRLINLLKFLNNIARYFYHRVVQALINFLVMKNVETASKK